MNKKGILIIISIIIIAVIPIVVIGANRFQRKIDGKKVVMLGEDMSDIEDGEKLILAAPVEEKSGEEDDLERKKAYEANMYSEDNIAQPTVKQYSAEELREMEEYEKEQAELRKKEQQVLNVLYKYYEQEYVDRIVNEGIENGYSSDYRNYSKQVEELIEITVQVLEKENLSKEDEEILRFFLEFADLNMVANNELKTRIRNLGIEI